MDTGVNSNSRFAQTQSQVRWSALNSWKCLDKKSCCLYYCRFDRYKAGHWWNLPKHTATQIKASTPIFAHMHSHTHTHYSPALPPPHATFLYFFSINLFALLQHSFPLPHYLTQTLIKCGPWGSGLWVRCAGVCFLVVVGGSGRGYQCGGLGWRINQRQNPFLKQKQTAHKNKGWGKGRKEQYSQSFQRVS